MTSRAFLIGQKGAALIALLACLQTARASGFIKARGTHFEKDGKPYYFLGTNFWYGLNLGSKGAGGDTARLARELDRLQSMGVTNLRIVGGSEGPNSEPWRMAPALQPEPEVYDKKVLDGLDRLISEIERRGMSAVVVLNNFWPWSGGMAQYVRWHGGGPIPYPPPQPGGDWGKYQKYTAQFYSNQKAAQHFDRFLKFLILRKNPYTKRRYRDEPAIMAWELANEPRGNNNSAAFNEWIEQTSSKIKSLDPNHLVTTGCEGDTPWPQSSGLEFVTNHQSANIDYATIHIWSPNWGWYDPAKADSTYPVAVEKMKAYLTEHVDRAAHLGKPVVLEEFGIGRDNGSYEPSAGISLRDRYYTTVFEETYQLSKSGSPLAGVNFWAWAGEGRSRKPGGVWKTGDPFTGDPPHEYQGWNSVYDADASTIKVISEYAEKFNRLNRAKP